MTSQTDLLDLKREELALKEAEQKLIDGLPFLYGFKWYTWAREFYESRNPMSFLCAANQISKSSTAIRKCVNWATDKVLWKELWAHTPNQFWYLYPSKDIVNAEFETKWKQFLPKGEYKDDPVYGWKEFKKGSDIAGIRFFSGVTVFFKTYAQDESKLQSGTVDALFCDEELPTNLLDELLMRVSASEGYFNMVFTATLGQDYWRRCIEPNVNDQVVYPEAFKRQVSMYDCLFYEDGTPSQWTPEKIAIRIKRCKNRAQVLKRIYGKFVQDSGLKYESFDREKNMKPKDRNWQPPAKWHVYGAADVGSGGEDGHPSAIAFVAVSPDFKTGRVYMGWRGDGIQTTAGDVVKKFRAMKGKQVMAGQYYDWACRDFLTIANTMGEPFMPADKSHERGEEILNVLFKNQMLYIYADDPELEKLAGELMTLLEETDKRKAKDDFIDALRYAVTQIPWDFSGILAIEPEDHKVQTADEFKRLLRDDEMRARRGEVDPRDEQEARLEEEFAEIDALLHD